MSRLRLPATVAATLVAGAVPLMAGAAAADPAVTLNPSSGFYDQQVIEVSVPANSLFVPNTTVKILECSVGATSDKQCDGNTVNADPVVVHKDGSVDYKAYQLFELPNPIFGPSTITCNATVPCDLYVGENQNDFSQPKLFSSPFTIAATAPTPTLPESPSVPLEAVAGGAALAVGAAAVALRRRSNRRRAGRHFRAES